MGARLGFGVGQHAQDRVLSFTLGGQHAYAIDADGPVTSTVTGGMGAARHGGAAALVEALEGIAGGTLPEPQRSQWLSVDPLAVSGAWQSTLQEGLICTNLSQWRTPCLIYAAANDADFHDGAQRAPMKIPGACFISFGGLDHHSVHKQLDQVIPAVIELQETC